MTSRNQEQYRSQTLEAPSAPSFFQASQVSSDQVVLVWRGSVDTGGSGLAGYRLSRNGLVLTEMLSAQSVQYVDDTVEPETIYTYSLVAIDRAVPGNESAPVDVNAHTESESSPGVSEPALVQGNIVPSTPGRVAAFDITSGTVRLQWGESTDSGGGNAVSYNIYRNGELIGSVEDLSYQDTGLEADTSYTYQVTAVDSSTPAIESDSAPAVVAVTLPAPASVPPSVPQNFAAERLDNENLLFTWDAVLAESGNGGLEGYRIVKDGVAQDVIIQDTQWQDSDPDQTRAITYAVRAVSVSGLESDASAEITVAPPTISSVNQFTGTAV